jgi:hypothetical protein
MPVTKVIRAHYATKKGQQANSFDTFFLVLVAQGPGADGACRLTTL